MAIIGFAGFDDRTVTAATNIATVPLPLMGGTEDAGLSIACARGQYVTQWGIAAAKDPDGMDCNGYFLGCTNSGSSIYNHATFGPPLESLIVNDAALDKTGTWHWGANICVMNLAFATAGSTVAVIGDTASSVPSKPVLGYNLSLSTYPDVINLVSGVGYYVEFTIDWENKTIYGYVNGKLTATTTFTGTPICQVGNIAKPAPYLIGNQPFGNQLATGNYIPTISHVYFIVNPKGAANPTGRLGSCRVRTAPLQSALVEDAKVVGSLSLTDTLNQTRPLTSTLWGNYVQLPSGTTRMVVQPTPVTLPTTEAILAARWGVMYNKPADQSAGLTLRVGDGTNMSSQYQRVGDYAGIELSKFMPLAPDGGVWTEAKLNSFLFRLGSYEL